MSSSNSTVSSSVNKRLSSTRWRIINSWWIYPPILSLGLLNWLGFLSAALRTGMKRYKVWTVIYATTLVAFFALSSRSSLAAVLLLFNWIVPTVHAVRWNRQYLIDLANRGVKLPTVATSGQFSQIQPGSPMNQPEFMGVRRDEYYASGSPVITDTLAANPAVSPSASNSSEVVSGYNDDSDLSTNEVNVNTASTHQLVASIGMAPQLAEKIVAIRKARGPYRDLEDLVQTANLQPHEMVRVRGKLAFSEPAPDIRMHGHPGGRVLDW